MDLMMNKAPLKKQEKKGIKKKTKKKSLVQAKVRIKEVGKRRATKD